MRDLKKLEELIERNELASNLKYSNPKRKTSVFSDLVNQYAASLGTQVNEIPMGLLDNLKRSAQNLGAASSYSGIPYPDKVSIICEEASRLLLMPVFYPILGGGYCMRVDGNNIDIAVPKWKGFFNFFIDYKSHELMHVYHALVARDLREKGVIDINGFSDIACEPLTPYFFRAPDYKQLKRFEREVLSSILRHEKTNGGKQ